MADAITGAELDAYSLLSKPTLSLTDGEVLRIVEDLRKRRERHIATGKPDKPAPKAAAPKPSADEKKAQKAALTAQLLSQIKIPGLDD